MIRMLILVCIAAPSLLWADKEFVNRLDYAIEHSDASKVAELINSVDCYLNSAQKKEFYAQLLKHANDVIDKRSKISIFSNNWDYANYCVGGILATGLPVAAVCALIAYDKNKTAEAKYDWQLRTGAAGVIGIVGACMWYLGYTCTTQKKILKNAEEIAHLLRTKRLHTVIDKYGVA